MSRETTSARVSAFTLVAAIIFVAVYLAGAWFMFETFALGPSPRGSNYDRAATIFAGVQSIGLAAAGVLLGVTVQQPVINNARAGEWHAKKAIRDVLANPPANELGGGNALSAKVRDRLMEGLL